MSVITVGMKKVLVIPDTHAPYHDERAWRLMLQVARVLGVDIIIVLGDFFDCYCVSDHRKDAARERDLKKELATGFKMLRELESLGASELVFIEGNHEWRLPRYLDDVAPQLKQWVMEKWDAEFSKWKYIEYMDGTKLGRINYTHDLGKSGAGAVLDALVSYGDNAVIGHVHGMEYRVRGDANGIPHVGASFGWLGDREKIDYKHQMKARREWILGFGWGHMRPDGVTYLAPIPMVDYTCVVDGKYFEQRSLRTASNSAAGTKEVA